MNRVALIRLAAVAFAVLLGAARQPVAPKDGARQQPAQLQPQAELVATCERILPRGFVADSPFAPAAGARVDLPCDIIRPSAARQRDFALASAGPTLPHSRAPPALS